MENSLEDLIAQIQTLSDEFEKMKGDLAAIRKQFLDNRQCVSSEYIKYEIIDNGEYWDIFSRQDFFAIKFTRQYDKSKENHNWVIEGQSLIALDIEGLFMHGAFKQTLIMSPGTGIIEYVKNRNIKENEMICRIKKYSPEEKQIIFDSIEREEIRDAIIKKERKKLIERETLDELISEGKIFNVYTKADGSRQTVPIDIASAVWNRDGGKCCICGSKENLEFDHIIPVSKGGATTFRNLQLLCHNCNMKKSDKI